MEGGARQGKALAWQRCEAVCAAPVGSTAALTSRARSIPTATGRAEESQEAEQRKADGRRDQREREEDPTGREAQPPAAVV